MFSFENETESVDGRKETTDVAVEGKGKEKRDAEAAHGCHAFFRLSLSRVLYLRYFSLSPSRSLDISSSSFRRFRLYTSLFVSHTESRGGGRWWWWSCPDGGGLWWGGSWFLRAYTVPYLSFLSLWEGEEGPVAAHCAPSSS